MQKIIDFWKRIVKKTREIWGRFYSLFRVFGPKTIDNLIDKGKTEKAVKLIDQKFTVPETEDVRIIAQDKLKTKFDMMAAAKFIIHCRVRTAAAVLLEYYSNPEFMKFKSWVILGMWFSVPSFLLIPETETNTESEKEEKIAEIEKKIVDTAVFLFEAQKAKGLKFMDEALKNMGTTAAVSFLKKVSCPDFFGALKFMPEDFLYYTLYRIKKDDEGRAFFLLDKLPPDQAEKIHSKIFQLQGLEQVPPEQQP